MKVGSKARVEVGSKARVEVGSIARVEVGKYKDRVDVWYNKQNQSDMTHHYAKYT